MHALGALKLFFQISNNLVHLCEYKHISIWIIRVIIITIFFLGKGFFFKKKSSQACEEKM